MTRVHDPLRVRPYAERLHYATGELLGADDFRDEQTYHRRQLARALLFVHGSGSVAGLRVTSTHRPGTAGAPDEVEIEVEPGLAVDRLGRTVEVPRSACLRLRRWFEYGAGRAPQDETLEFGQLDRDDLREAWRADASPTGGSVVADVFLAFHPCERGYTPAFATGPFDALDASQPSRVRDGYQLSLVPRPEPDADLAALVGHDPWSGITGATAADRARSAREISLSAWTQEAPPPPDHLGAFRENPAGVDPTAVLIARIRIPAAASLSAAAAPRPDWSASAWSSANVDNHVRHFVLPAAALSRIGLA